MISKYKIVFFILLLIITISLVVYFVLTHNSGILNPKGIIATSERNLIVTAVSLGLAIIIPTFFLTFYIATKYRDGNNSAEYSPDWERGPKLTALIWAIPTVVILILAVINWNTTHALDPFKPLNSDVKPITIQVVALRWKWLFIYPEQGIASVNYVQFPQKTPVNFQLTADAPMNSFWIPQLGGQIYAMTGMSTKLHLQADSSGDFPGSAAEINGEGFSEMKFIAHSSSQADFNSWVQEVKQSQNKLDSKEYINLSKPSENTPVSRYILADDFLYDNIIMKFLMPADTNMSLTHM